MHPVTATLDPSAPVTIVTPDLADRLGAEERAGDTRALPRGRVVGIDHSEMKLARVSVARSDGVVIGADVLKEMVLRLDFGRNRLRVVDQAEYRKATANLVAVPVSVTPDGCLSIAGATRDGQPVRAALIGRAGGDAAGSTTTLQTGQIVFAAQAQPATRSQCAANDMLITWQSFEDQTIMLDLGRNQIWLKRNAWPDRSE
jgi:hypothetical protein